jgi:cob(I)alamin adenosyltransferase
MVHVYNGDGKGKTTSAAGLAVRAAGAGLRVLFLQFDKGFLGENYYCERFSLGELPGVEVVGTGCQRLMDNGGFRFRNLEEDFAEAQRALALAREAIRGGKHDLIVLDEAVTCVQTGLLKAEEVESLLDLHAKHPRAELILTGRGAWPALIERANLVTEMTMRKHYFTRGVRLRRGIDH